MANEELSNLLTRMGEGLEKLFHIHKSSKCRWEDLDTKKGMILVLVFWLLVLAPITPIGKEIFSWGSSGTQAFIMFLPIPALILLFANLHPEADCGEFYDEDGYDNVKEDKK